MRKRHLTTAAEVFAVLGDIQGVMALTGGKRNQVANWKYFNAFPPKTYVAMTAALERAGKTAPASLWGMVGAREEAERASA